MSVSLDFGLLTLSYSDNLPYTYCEQIGKEIRDISDEIPFEIPDSWEWVNLSQIAICDLGKTLDKSKNTGNYQPYLCSINVYWNGIDLSKIEEARFEDSELPKYLLKKGDLLICEGGEVGRCCVWDKEVTMYYQNALHRVRFYGNINPYYFKYLMQLYKGTGIIDAHSKGVTIKHLVQKSLNSIYFPLPPLSEQHRIVAKIEKLLPYIEEYDKAETKLTALNETFPEMLKKSILQEAVQGKLVPQDPNDEPASVLLERIRAEKQRLIKQGKIKKDKHESVIVTRDKIPYEIPESWGWCRLGDILLKLTDGTHSTPKYIENGVPFISVKDVSTGKLNFSNCKYISEKEHIELYERCNPEIGDILLTKVGTTGIPVIVDTERQFSLFVSVALLKFNQELIYNRYLVYMINSPLVQKQAIENTKGVGNKNWVMRDIANTLIVIPPIDEQHRIVAKIEEIMPYINTITK